MTPELFDLLDAVGTAAFAMSGAFKAARHRLDLLGVLVLGFVTAMGGGVVRDLLIQRVPVALLSNGPAFYSLVGCLLAILWQLRRRSAKNPGEGKAFLIVDALGLATFAVTGSRLGHEAGLTAWSTVLLAAVTGVGGGAIRDMLVCEVPLVLKADFYATAALAGGLVYVALAASSALAPLASLATFAVTLVLRVLAIFRGWHLPRLPE
jgi:uncharacterized membrane protein YeiH